MSNETLVQNILGRDIHESPPNEAELLRIITNLKEDARAARDRYIPSAQANMYMKGYIGDHYPAVDFSPYTKWKTRQTVNYTGEVIDFITSFLLDQSPKPVPIPPNEEQEELTELLDNIIDEIWKKNDMDSVKMEQFVKAALIMGISAIKVWFDPTRNEGEGEVIFDLVDPRDLYIDPYCQGSVNRCSYLIWEKYIPYEEAVRRFPKYRGAIEESITSDTTKEAKEEMTPQVTYFNFTATQTWDFAMISPQKDFTTKTTEGYLAITTPVTKVKVTEAWLRDYTMVEVLVNGKKVVKDKYRNNIRLVTIVGNKVVQDTSTPYVNLKSFPYVFLLDKPIPYESFGVGTVSQIWDIQLDINYKKSYIGDYMKFSGNPVWVIDKEAGIKRGSITNVPGLIINKAQHTEVRREPAPPIPSGFFESQQAAVNELKEISGATDVLLGKRQKGTRSAEQQMDLKDAAVGKLKLKLLGLKKAVGQMGEITLALVEQFFTPTRVLRIVGDYSQPIYLNFSSTMINGPWRIKTESMPSTPFTKQARFEQALRLFTMNIIGKKEVLDILEWPNKDKILKRAAAADQAYYNSLSQRIIPKTKKPPPHLGT